jgi:serine/threonine protein kinase
MLIPADSYCGTADIRMELNTNSMSSLDWLKTQVEANSIKSFDYAEFSEIKQVGEGGFGKVYKAYLKNRRMIVAFKTLKIDSIREFVREVNLIINS